MCVRVRELRVVITDDSHAVCWQNFHQKYQVDQNFLRDVVYPIVKDRALVHDEFFEKRPFPSDAPPRTNNYFVGQAYNHLDEPEFN